MSGAASQEESVLAFDVLKTREAAFSVDMSCRIVAWNDEAERLFGYCPGEAIGARCDEILRAGEDGGHICAQRCAAIDNARRGRTSRSFEALTLTRSGEPRWLHVSTLLAHSASGRKRIVHLLRDESEHHRLDESMARAMAQVQRAAATPSNGAPPPPRATPAPRQLTPREREVLRLLICGLATGEIATTLGISPITARNHVTNVMEKLGATTRLQAVLLASQLDLL